MLTAVGTYGVISYAVSRQRRDIGVRIALGAEPGEIRTRFLLMGVRLFALGATIGIAGFAATAGPLRGMLIGESAFDLRVLGGTTAVLAAVCLTACLVPALRASKVAPTEALRSE